MSRIDVLPVALEACSSSKWVIFVGAVTFAHARTFPPRQITHFARRQKTRFCGTSFIIRTLLIYILSIMGIWTNARFIYPGLSQGWTPNFSLRYLYRKNGQWAPFFAHDDPQVGAISLPLQKSHKARDTTGTF